MAAVDPMTDDALHLALNHQILEYSKMLGHLTVNPVHTVNTFQTPAMSPAIDVPGVDYELIRQDTSASHGEKMRGLHEEHEIALENMNLREGYPESAIPQTAEEIKAQILS